MIDADGVLTRVLWHVDGVPHVVLGPVAVVFAEPLADLVGVDPSALRTFLLVFTAYGAVVAAWLWRAGPGERLVALAIAANLAFAATVIVSLGSSPLTGLGTAVHVLVMLSALAVAKTLVLAAWARRPVTAAV